MTAKNRAELALLSMTFIWGGTFVVTKIGFDDISPVLLVALRFTVGTLFFIVFCFTRLKGLRASAVKKGFVLGALLGVGLLLQTIGLQYTSASKSAFITAMMVVFTPIAQLWIERRIPKPGNIIGVLIVTVGLYLLTSPGGEGFNFGDGITLAGSFVFGFYIVYLDMFTKTENFLHIVFLQILFTALIAWTFVPFETPRFILTSNLIGVLFYTGILATVITTYVQSRFQKDTTPTRAAVLFTFEPVISAVLAYYILHEVLGMIGVIGAGLIIFGIIVSELTDIFFKKFRWKFTFAEEE
jgi:drug/metabolite transporter (DMT)-like permease